MKHSKMPDLQEVIGMSTKLLKDLKKSVCEIVDEYKAKRQGDDDSSFDQTDNSAQMHNTDKQNDQPTNENSAHFSDQNKDKKENDLK